MPVLVAFLVAAALAQDPGRGILDRVVAVVNDEVLLLSELEGDTRRSLPWQEARAQLERATPAEVATKWREVRGQVLETMIDEVLVRKEAERFQITATDADVDRYLMQLATGNGYSTVDALKKDVEASGQYGTWAEYTQDLRDQILMWKAINSLAAPTVTDAQVRAYYRKMTKDEGAKVEVERFVFLPQGEGTRARDAAYASAQAVARRLRNAEPADKVAESLGLGPPKPVVVARGDVAPAVEDAIFAAKKNQIVGPLETGQGYLVVKVLEHKASSALTFEEAKDRIHDHLYQEAAVKAEKDFKQGLRTKAHVDIRL